MSKKPARKTGRGRRKNRVKLGDLSSLLERAMQIIHQQNQSLDSLRTIILGYQKVVQTWEKLNVEGAMETVKAAASVVVKPKLNCERDYGFVCRDAQLQMGYKEDSIN
jgi:hypothetical protein